MLERNEIDKKYKWDLTAIYKDEAAFDADIARCREKMAEVAKNEAVMLSSADALYTTLEGYAALEGIIEKLWNYASLSFSTDTSNNAGQALTARVRTLANEASEATWFVGPYLQRLDEATVESYISARPELKSFKRLIEKNLRQKPHTLSDECERLMSTMEEALGSSSEVRSIFSNSDLTFGKIKNSEGKSVELTDTSYIPFMLSPDRRVRRSAFKTLYKTYRQYANTYATLYFSRVKEECTLARARGFESSIVASTFRDEVTPVIYNNLIDTVNRGIGTLYDYYELKRGVLGLSRLHLYDVYAPLITEAGGEYSYEAGVDEVLGTVEVYGREYTETLRRGLTELGWVDVYPTRGKRGGAFSAGCPDTEPYILLNYAGSIDDVFTLAHEAGHSMHSYFSIKNNEPHNSSYTIFVAEVASTVNELLLAHRLLREAKSDAERLYVLNQLMETYKGTLFRQTMFAEFERDMHALWESGRPLTADIICEKYYELNRRYFGARVEVDPEIACEWMRIPHFYTPFYVYKYATCISAASAIVKRIECEGDAYVSRYLDFLRAGDSMSPLDSLLVAGIDMTSPEVITSAIDDFADCVKQFREIYERNK